MPYDTKDALEDYPKLQKLIEDAPGLSVDMRLEGMDVTDGGLIKLGGRAGPTIEVSNICHELSHFVEIDVHRCAMPGWGLKYPEPQTVPRIGGMGGYIFYEFTTTAHLYREIRTWAWQYHLQKWAGLEESIQEITAACVVLPDTFLLIESYKSEEIRAKFIEETRAYVEKYTIEQFMERFEERCRYVETFREALRRQDSEVHLSR